MGYCRSDHQVFGLRVHGITQRVLSRVRLLLLSLILFRFIHMCVLIVHMIVISVSLISYAVYLTAKDHDDGT